MDRLKHMKESLINIVQAQISGNLESVNTEELGDAIDMIKDLEEAIYYCTITEAMNEGNSNGKEYETHKYYMPYFRDMDRPERMYYDDYNLGNRRMYHDKGTPMLDGKQGYKDGYYPDMAQPIYEYPMEIMRDPREGRSPISRKHYMESKDMHKDEAANLKELEMYLQELGQDITEMVQKASPEEKQMLQQKLSLLASKIK